MESVRQPSLDESGRRQAPDAPIPGERPRVPVWDAPVRVVHWANVVLLTLLIATGLAGGDWLLWHMRAGQALLVLVLFRIVWGFAGSPNARFRTFVRGPRRVAGYARSLARRTREFHASHNPLGAWMVLLLLAAMLVQCVTGLFANDDVLWEGPLAKWVTKEASDAFSSIHRRAWWLLIAFASLHIIAAVAYVVAFRDDLIHAMITGRKRLPPGVAVERGAEASPARALAIASACALAVWYVLHRL